MSATKREAEKVLSAVRRRYRGYYDRPQDGPTLMQDWSLWSAAAPRWSVVWEMGPYDWAVEWSPDDTPEGLWTEAQCSFALAVYRED